MQRKEEIRDEASEYLGRELTDAEFAEAYPMAKRKLDAIVQREGDANGERLKPCYIGQLIAEHIRMSAFSRFTAEMYNLLHGGKERSIQNVVAEAHT